MMSKASVAVILSGCGVFDGSEVHEASAAMAHLSRNNADYKIYAPDIKQMHVINHTTGDEMKEERNVLVESARIARGTIESLDKLSTQEHDAVILPGGFGAAKNLSNFAVKYNDCVLNDEVSKVINDFHSAGKPIGLCCIAPVLVAKTIPGCEITLGKDTADDPRWPHAGAAGAAVAMGAKHVNKEVHEVHVDTKNKIVTSPAYMCEAEVHEIHDGVGEMVKAVLRLIV